jgi:hypothetical protein
MILTTVDQEHSVKGADALPSQPLPGQIKQILRQSIDDALQTAKELATEACLTEIRTRLSALQAYCKAVEKVFIVVEESITCDRYGLGGRGEDAATLFRGPKDDASVAICVTHKGSLLYRNGSIWKLYKDAGDTHPAIQEHL